jgi:hypothetical protein
MLVFSAGYLFAGGGQDSNTKPRVDRNSWKQSSINVKYNNGPSGVSISVILNGITNQYLQPGQSISLNCPEGSNYLVVASPNDSKRIDVNSELNVTSIEFNIVPEPIESKITLNLKDGKKSSNVNILLNGILNSTIGLGQIIKINVPDGNNTLELQSRKYKETINILSNSNNTFIEFNTSKVLAKLENVNVVKTEQLTMYTVQNLDIVNIKIVVMPDELRKQIEEEDRQTAEEERQNELLRQRLNNFIYKSKSFTAKDIQEYKNGDIFEAASASRNLQITSNKQDALIKQLESAFMLGLGGVYILQYVSNLTFVRQNGTDIVFSSDDEAISQRMIIDQRSGLQPGQKVRVYYMVTQSPLTTWDVIAIEPR